VWWCSCDDCHIVRTTRVVSIWNSSGAGRRSLSRGHAAGASGVPLDGGAFPAHRREQGREHDVPGLGPGICSQTARRHRGSHLLGMERPPGDVRRTTGVGGDAKHGSRDEEPCAARDGGLLVRGTEERKRSPRPARRVERRTGVRDVRGHVLVPTPVAANTSSNQLTRLPNRATERSWTHLWASCSSLRTSLRRVVAAR
jgi:hypothetical protein